MAMLIIVDSCGVLFSIDSHIHGTEGAVNVCFHPDSLQFWGLARPNVDWHKRSKPTIFFLSPQFNIHESASVSKNILFVEVILQDYFGKYEGHKQ